MTVNLFAQRACFTRFPSHILRDIFDLIHSLTFYCYSETDAVLYGWLLIIQACAQRFHPPRVFPWQLHLTSAPLPWNPVPYVQPWPCLLSFYHPMRLYFHHCWHDTYLFVVCLPLLEHKHAESRSMPVYLHWYLSRWGHITQQVLSKCIEWMKKWMNESEILNYMVLIEHKKIGLEN